MEKRFWVKSRSRRGYGRRDYRNSFKAWEVNQYEVYTFLCGYYLSSLKTHFMYF